MRRVIRILAAVLFLVPAAVLLAADAQAEKDAEAAARAWLAGVDAGKYGASWEAASSEFRKSMTKTQWDSYGPGADPRCEHCMMHCGFEPSAALGINTRISDTWKLLSSALR